MEVEVEVYKIGGIEVYTYAGSDLLDASNVYSSLTAELNDQERIKNMYIHEYIIYLHV